MGSYLATKYKGIYNLMAEIDQRTGDFCRDKNGDLENYSDVWIVCDGKCRIYHYGKSTLQFYCPTIGRGHNIVKALYDLLIGDYTKFETVQEQTTKTGEIKEVKTFDYNSMYRELESNKIVYGFEETSEEVLFKFLDKNLSKLSDVLKPKSTCLWSPFSLKYLRQNVRKSGNKYEISSENLAKYKTITSIIPKGKMRIYVDINKAFINKLATQKTKLDTDKLDKIKNEIKVGGFKTYEYFCSLGEETWNSYLEFLKSEIDKKLNEN